MFDIIGTRMSEFPIDLLIKQTLRSVVFQSSKMGSGQSRDDHLNISSKQTTNTAFSSLIKHPESLKWLFEKPRDNMYKIFENVSAMIVD